MKILIVEDDKNIAEITRAGLSADGHTVDVADNGSDGSFLARSYEYDVIILDNSLPKKDGVTITKELRSMGKKVPIIFLSIVGDVDTKVLALESGADDYVTKPFSIQELCSRVRAVTRRAPDVKSSIISIDDLIVDTIHKTVKRNNKNIELTKKEFALLEYLIRNKGLVLSRAQIMEHVWSIDSDPFSNTVEAHIRNLRKKININRQKELINNRPGHGYIMDLPKNK